MSKRWYQMRHTKPGAITTTSARDRQAEKLTLWVSARHIAFMEQEALEPVCKSSFFRKPPVSRAPTPLAGRVVDSSSPPSIPQVPPPAPVRPAATAPPDQVTPPPPPSRPRAPASPFGGLPGASATRQPLFRGEGGTLFGIHIVNVLFTLGTLGWYYFWAKTRTRRFLFSQTEFEGDRFAYHGTGKELLIGTLKAVLVFGLPLLLLKVVQEHLDVHIAIKITAGILSSIVGFSFVPVAIVGARRYRLSRTSWRGIHFSFRGRTWPLMKIFIRGSLLSLLTFGFYYPYFLVRRQAFLVSNTYFGNEHFDFAGHGRDLMEHFVRAILLTPFTLGLYWFWWMARKRRYLWERTQFGAARFHSTVSGGALLRLYVVNALLLLCTLGFAWPWVKVRNVRFAFRYLTLVGPVDLERIRQQAQFASSTGEGLAGFFDTGFDLA